MKSSPSSAAGFTLIELMLVVTVAGVLAMIAIPNFKSLTQSQRVKNASFQLYSALSLARSEAIKRNTNVTLDTTLNAANEISWVIRAGATEISTQGYIKGIAMTVSNTAATEIVYQSTGRTTDAGPTFVIYSADTTAAASPFTRCITIELSGMPRTRKGVCS